MGVSTQDIFGGSGQPEPATPGSYGVAPSGFRLPEDTRVGAVRLQVADLGRSVDWYGTVLGLRATSRADGEVSLAVPDDGRVLVELRERPGVRPPRGRLGLYHFAILLPERQALGRFVRHLAELGVRARAGDHLVSEAFYLTDPDGLMIEVYADRPRDAWRRVGRELMMATDPVDVPGLVRDAGHEPWRGMPAGTVMGHMHLHVGDLARAAAFYHDGLGFDRVVWSYPGALFLAAGGYHHHVGANTWAGAHARPAGDDEARLLEWTLQLPDAAGVAEARASLERQGCAVDAADDGFVARDPWETAVRVRTANSTWRRGTEP